MGGGIDRSFVLYIFSVFTGVWRVCGCMRVYVGGCAHTHSLRLGTRDVSRRVSMGRFESMKNPDGLKLRINISVYVCEVHMYI